MVEDNFVRADSDPMSGNWTQNCISNVRIISNATERTGGAIASVFYNVGTFLADQFAEVRFLTLGLLSDIDAACRVSGATFFQLTCYLAEPLTTDEQLAKYVSSVYTQLASVSTTNAVVGDFIRLEVEGTTLRYVQNGVVKGSTTDTSIVAANSPGMQFFETNCRLKDFRGGDLSSLRALNGAMVVCL